ncbi:MAG: PIN domain-containing protein [Chitinophagales bacterium]|nr:PIN domain-containing protein [Chitinophagales bacterium]
MKLCVCDTDMLFEYFEDNTDAIDLLNSYDIIFCSVITQREMVLSSQNKTHQNKLNKLLTETVTLIPIEREISDLHVQLLNDYHLSHSLKINDAIIAATAIYYNLPLSTCNIKDFKFIPDLLLVQLNIIPKRRGGVFFDLFK